MKAHCDIAEAAERKLEKPKPTKANFTNVEL
jgi:hypothetical protein